MGEVVGWAERALNARCHAMWVRVPGIPDYFRNYLQNAACILKGVLTYSLIYIEETNAQIQCCGK